MHNNMYHTVSLQAFKNACKKVCAEIHGQISTSEFNKLLKMVKGYSSKTAAQIKREMRMNRSKYRRQKGLTEDPVDDNMSEASASQSLEDHLQLATNHFDAASDGSSYETATATATRDGTLLEELESVDPAEIHYIQNPPSLNGIFCNPLSAPPPLQESRVREQLVDSPGQVSQVRETQMNRDIEELGSCFKSMNMNLSVRDPIILPHELGKQCLVIFELTGNVARRKCHRVQVSDDCLHLEYLSQVPEFKLNAWKSMHTFADDSSYHQTVVGKAIKERHFKNITFPLVKIDGSFWIKKSFALPFQVMPDLHDQKLKK